MFKVGKERSAKIPALVNLDVVPPHVSRDKTHGTWGFEPAAHPGPTLHSQCLVQRFFKDYSVFSNQTVQNTLFKLSRLY